MLVQKFGIKSLTDLTEFRHQHLASSVGTVRKVTLTAVIPELEREGREETKLGQPDPRT